MVSTFRTVLFREETRDDGKLAFLRVPLLTDGTLNINDEDNIISSNFIKALVWNASGSTIAAGTSVFPSGYNNTEELVQISAAQSNNDSAMPSIGIVESDIVDGASGIIVQVGTYSGIDTSGQSVGDRVYLSRSSAGGISFSKTAQEIGKVLTSANPGVIYFNFLKGQEVFGADYISASEVGRTTTTSDTFQTKLSMTLPAVNGVFKVNWSGSVDAPDKKAGVWRLYNVTDAVAIQTLQYLPPEITDIMPVGGFGQVTVSGSSKIIEVQFRSTSLGKAVAISEAYMDGWRVS